MQTEERARYEELWCLLCNIRDVMTDIRTLLTTTPLDLQRDMTMDRDGNAYLDRRKGPVDRRQGRPFEARAAERYAATINEAAGWNPPPPNRQRRFGPPDRRKK